eukprot:g10344.t1
MKLAWQSALLLPLVLLPIDVTEAQRCSNLVKGYEDEVNGVCCPRDCEVCEEDGCSDRGEGCCPSDVLDSGILCSDSEESPCIMEYADDSSDSDDSSDDEPEEMCTDGVPGLLDNNACCPTSCGECGGDGCSERDGGDEFSGRLACCRGAVLSLGRVCSDTVGAPCEVSEEDSTDPVDSTADSSDTGDSIDSTTDSTTDSSDSDDSSDDEPEEMCTDGVPGLLDNTACCPTSCGECGGDGCSERDGGDEFSGRLACCRGAVLSLGRVCSDTVGAPCEVSEEDSTDPVNSTTDSSDTGDSIDSTTESSTDDDESECSNGLPGYETNDVCCPLSCGECGGIGCSGRGEGCCTSEVQESGNLCSEKLAAPCNVDGPLDSSDSEDSSDDDESECSNGLPGYETNDVCCPLSCGECGGIGCSGRGEGCCTSEVQESGDLCSETLAAPCNVDGPLDSSDSDDSIDSTTDSSDDDSSDSDDSIDSATDSSDDDSSDSDDSDDSIDSTTDSSDDGSS